MAYRLPTFNLLSNIWHNQLPPVGTPVSGPPIGAPDEVVVPTQLYQGRFSWGTGYIELTEVDPGGASPYLVYECLRFPKTVNVSGPFGTRSGDIVECEAGSSYYYAVWATRRQHLGFPNEYLEALCLLYLKP